MSEMFCFQCQEAAKGTGCTIQGVCGKTSEVANLQDLLVYTLKGIAIFARSGRELGITDAVSEKFIIESLFATITNANFVPEYFTAKIREGLALRDLWRSRVADAGVMAYLSEHDAAIWNAVTDEELMDKAATVGVLATEHEDIRSLRELLTYGLKGMAAYMEHAAVLGFYEAGAHAFMEKGLAAALDNNLSGGELTALVLECGKFGVDVMALLDRANTAAYGNPEITKVNIGVGTNPGILISGHDLKDMEALLKQTEGTGVDVYTHSEMLPAHYYPAFKKYSHFVGNYGNAWWKQNEEFASFNGPILMTTNCIVPPKDSYKDRLYTTGNTGYPGIQHIAAGADGEKNFSALIEQAKSCSAPVEIETGEIIGGFAHAAVMNLADQVVGAVESGAIKQFFVMAGCDGRMKSRNYYTDFAAELPSDTVILTAGCAKYKYNKLALGDIGEFPACLMPASAMTPILLWL